MSLAFHHFPGACSLATHIVLHEVVLAFEPVRVALLDGEQRTSGYLAVNPSGKVPALIINGSLLSETPAILAWLADQRPEAGLLPLEPLARAQVISLVTWMSGTLHPGYGRIFRPDLTGAPQAAWDDVRAFGKADVQAGLARLEALLGDQDWFFGDYSIADPLALVMSRWGFRFGLDMASLPRLVAHGRRVATRPAASLAIADEGIEIDR
ncbi:MAG: glutathione S-transferase N-terminal domain-containing protein [Hyphomonadaceae bacterium]|nr:glutathione S-transferase N-terminal domain-containing protein [Hyphomonadaceae bacterium]